MSNYKSTEWVVLPLRPNRENDFVVVDVQETDKGKKFRRLGCDGVFSLSEARLIAAAPDLYNALLEVVDIMTCEEPEELRVNRVMLESIALISKLKREI